MGIREQGLGIVREYIKECRQRFSEDRSRVNYVRCVFWKARHEERDKQLVLKGTMAFLQIRLERGPNRYISVKAIQSRSGIESGSATKGLWPWLENEADVVQENPNSLRHNYREFRIRTEFFESMQQLYETDLVTAKNHSIVELQGLGKEIYEGVDAQEYVYGERSSWDDQTSES